MGIIDCNKAYSPGAGSIGQANCILTYTSEGKLRFPENGHVLSPWVAIDFVDQSREGGGAAITVSNRSSDSTTPPHCAAIKNFDLGHSDGTAVRVLIHDTQGGSFEKFMEHLVGDWMVLKEANPATLLMKVQFGWVKNGCGNSLPRASSPCYYVICDSVEANFSDGKFIFEITGRDMGFRMFEGGAELQLGGEGDQGMYLMDAITKLMTDSMAPNVGSVELRRVVEGENQIWEFGGTPKKGDKKKMPVFFKAEDEKEKRRGPKGKYVTQGQNKLEAIRRWLDEHPSNNDRGWIIQYDTTAPKGKIVIWEDSKPYCEVKGRDYWDANSLGSYVVNGGKASSVLEFNPKIRWDFGMVTSVGGNAGDGRMNSMGTEGAKHPGTDCMPADKLEGAGQVTFVEPSDTAKDIHGADAVKEVAKAEAQAKKAITISTFGAITADLVIIGDPSFASPLEAIGIRSVTIVVLNPFYLGKSRGQTAWIAEPACHAVLSNNAWIIKSVSHHIEAGTYTTTLTVELTTPGIHVPAGMPFGASDVGWTPV